MNFIHLCHPIESGNYLSDLITENFAKVSIVFLSVNDMNRYNDPSGNSVFIVAVKSGNNEVMTHTAVYALEGTKTLQDVVTLTESWTKPGAALQNELSIRNHSSEGQEVKTSNLGKTIADLAQEARAFSGAETRDGRLEYERGTREKLCSGSPKRPDHPPASHYRGRDTRRRLLPRSARATPG